MKHYLLILTTIFTFFTLNAQVIFQPIASSVYKYIDEMANIGVIEINSAVKPYSRKLISEKLHQIDLVKKDLNKRQIAELEFYLKDFNKELIRDKTDFDKRIDAFYYSDSLFQFTINPIAGAKAFYSSNSFNTSNWSGVDLPFKYSKADAFHRYSGAEIYGSIGEHFAFSASLRDNGLSQNLYGHNLLVNHTGGVFKINQGQNLNRLDYSDMQGAITYSWFWGSVSIRKDNFTWGDNYNGANILSDRAPSYAYLNLKLNPVKWFDFNYIHGWLVSQEIDSSATYYIDGQRRRKFFNKYIAANIYTFRPLKNTYFSLGNSIIYSDQGINAAYLIPFLFYKSIDHTYNGAGSNDIGQNAQMFMNISSRALKYTNFYFSMFLDEINIGNAFDKNKHTNLYSIKGGARISNLIPNTILTFEYTRTTPWTYRHQIARTTYASNKYSMGHYLGENSQEIFGSLTYKPVKNLHFTLQYTKTLKGPEHTYALIYGNANVTGLKFLEKVEWKNQIISLKVSYELINDGYLFTEIINSSSIGEQKYLSPLYQGNTNTVILGFNYGF